MISKGLKIRALLLSLFGTLVIGVTALSTMAWFTIQQPNLTNDFTTGSGSVSIDTDNIYGFKKAATLDPNTKEMNYDASAIASRKLNTQDTHTNQGSTKVDTNFNVPTDGVGYYLVTGKSSVVDEQVVYSYPYVDNEIKNYVKLSEISRPQRAYADVTLQAGTRYRFMHYSFSNATGETKTVNEKIFISNDKLMVADGNVTTVSGDLTVTATKSYKLWLNYGKNTVTLENGAGKIAPKSRKKAAGKPMPRHALASGDFGAFINLNTFFSSWGTMTEPNFYLDKVSNSDSAFNTLDDNFRYAPYSASSANGGTLNFKIKENSTWKYFHVQKPTGGYQSGHYYRLDYESGTAFGNWSGDYAATGFKMTDITSTLKTVTIYVDFSWPTSSAWSPNLATDPSIHAWGNNPVLSESAQAMELYENSIYRYTLQFFTSINGLQFYCTQSGNRKSTVDLTGSPADGEVWMIKLSKTWTGDKMDATFTKSGPSTTTNRIYVFDPLNLGAGNLHVYAYGDSSSVAPSSNQPWPGVALTSAGSPSGLYYADISESYGTFIINDGDAAQTPDYSLTTYKTKYLVLNYKKSSEDSIFDNASWYSAINTVSSTKKTYYVYDKANKLGSASSIYAYAWTENDHTDGAGTYVYPYQNNAWPGVKVTATSTTGLYQIEVSESYDHIIFNNGSNAVQTVDEDIDPSTPYFILDGTSTTSGGVTKWGGSWMETLVGIQLSCVYYYDSDIVELPEGETYYYLGRDVTDGHTSYTPTLSVTSNVDYGDSDNGMYYRFVPQSGWLIKDGSGNYVTYTTQVLSSATTLYKKYLASSSDMVQMYIDINEANTKNSENQWTGVTVHDSSGTKILDNVGSKIAQGTDYFYSVSINKNAISTFFLSNGVGTTGHNTIGDGSGATHGTLSLPSTSGSYLYVFETDNGKTHTTGFLTKIDSSVTGTVNLAVTSGGSTTNYTMGSGDLSINYAIYERGIQINENSTISITVSNATGDYSSYNGTYGSRTNLVPDSETGTTAKYLDSSVSAIKVKTAARYNFYLAIIDGNLKVAIAQVPILGNGYYIMKYTDTTNGYMDSYKMTDYDDDYAAYSGFNINSIGEKYYIRSYLNAVDTLYKNAEQFNVDSRLADKVNVNNSTGVITFNATGQYNISHNDGVISITMYTIDEFFSLKPVIGSTHTNIKDKETSFVFEVPFTVTSPVDSTIALFVNNPAENSNGDKVLGFSLYVSNHRISDTSAEHLSPYDYMRANHYVLSSDSLILDRSSITFDSSTTTKHYAYILIDYVTTNVPSYVPSMPSFYLQLRQAN